MVKRRKKECCMSETKGKGKDVIDLKKGALKWTTDRSHAESGMKDLKYFSMNSCYLVSCVVDIKIGIYEVVIGFYFLV